MAKKEKAERPSGKFVVLHSKLGQLHSRGDVIGADDLPDETDFDRLVNAGAIREATAEEGKLNSVTLVGDTGAPPADVASQEQRVAALRGQIEKLHSELADAQDAMNRQKIAEANRTAEKTPQAMTELIVAKDKVANDLRAENESLKAQLASARGGSTVSTEPASADADYEAQTVPELRELAAKHKVDVPAHGTKADTIAALKSAGVRAPKAK